MSYMHLPVSLPGIHTTNVLMKNSFVQEKRKKEASTREREKLLIMSDQRQTACYQVIARLVKLLIRKFMANL